MGNENYIPVSYTHLVYYGGVICEVQDFNFR